MATPSSADDAGAEPKVWWLRVGDVALLEIPADEPPGQRSEASGCAYDAQNQARDAAFLADTGRGLARDPRTRREAVRWLLRAESAAPQWIRNNPAARESVAYLLDRATAAVGGRELRGMAARMSVPH